jgi:hypothetical protein
MTRVRWPRQTLIEAPDPTTAAMTVFTGDDLGGLYVGN